MAGQPDRGQLQGQRQLTTVPTVVHTDHQPNKKSTIKQLNNKKNLDNKYCSSRAAPDNPGPSLFTSNI